MSFYAMMKKPRKRKEPPTPAVPRMERWVEREGTTVRFGNLVGGFVGREYVYTCQSIEQATAFAEYAGQREPGNDLMPTAITDEIRARFQATRKEVP